MQDLREVLALLKSAIESNIEEDVEILLFGSAARGEYTEESDIDILVLVVGEVDRKREFEIMDIAYELGLEYDLIFGILVYSRDFWHSEKARSMSLYRNIEKEGIQI